MSNSVQDTTGKNPTELLRDQVVSLHNIEEVLNSLQTSQERMLESLSGLYKINTPSKLDGAEVYIENINMPLWDMVRFLVKLSIASIPAAIVMLVLGFLAWLIIGSVIIGFLAAIG